MTEQTFRKAWQEAHAELSDLMRQREILETRIAQLQQIITSLDARLKPLPGGLATAFVASSESLGLIEACRRVLRAAAGDALTPVELRDGLKRIGFDIDAHSNILASIHTTLRRMVGSREVEEVQKDGNKAFRLRRAEHQIPDYASRRKPSRRKAKD